MSKKAFPYEGKVGFAKQNSDEVEGEFCNQHLISLALLDSFSSEEKPFCKDTERYKDSDIGKGNR